MQFTRRDFLGAIGGAVLLPSVGACSAADTGLAGPGRLTVRPRLPDSQVTPGVQSLPVDGADVRLFVPASYNPNQPAPLIVMLHGATQDADFSLDVMQPSASGHGHLLLAPKSAGITWDGIRGSMGVDVRHLNAALDLTFARCNVDPARLTLAGFSDGASYALSLGMINGDLFPRLLAFSPGFAFNDERHGQPRIFVSHGTADTILPIDRTSRLLVPALRANGYDVTYHEFNGPHMVPSDVKQRAMSWLET